MVAEWSFWVHDMATGNPIERLSVTADAPFSASLSGDGESSLTVVLSEQTWGTGNIRWLFDPNARMLVRWWGENGGAHAGDVVMCAHKIDSFDYDRDKGAVTVAAVDVFDFADWRLIDGVGADKYSKLSITNKSASGAVRAAVARMMQWNAQWQLPIDLPADGGGGFSGEWVFWKGTLIGDVLKEIRDRTGCEIYFAPYPTESGGVRFRTLVGAPIDAGRTHFHLEAEQSPLAGIRYRVDGANQVTGVEGIGAGTGEDQHRASAGGTVGIPIRDTRKSFPDLIGNELQQATDTYYAANVGAVIQWDIGSYTAGDGWGPELVTPGRTLEIEVYGDPVIPDGEHHVRVVKVSGDSGRVIQPEVQ